VSVPVDDVRETIEMGVLISEHVHSLHLAPHCGMTYAYKDELPNSRASLAAARGS
jgi:hypothetical protein